MSKIRITGDWDALHNRNPHIPFSLEFTDPKHLGLNAKFRIRHSVTVHDSDPADIDHVAFERQFVIAEPRCSIDVPASAIPNFGYRGSKIDIACQAEVVVDDAVFFDSKERQEVHLKYLNPNKDRLVANPSAEMSPRDEINFFRNFAVIALKQKLAWIGAFITFILGMVGNFVLALFDTFVAAQPILYSKDVDFGLFGAGIGAFIGGRAFAAVQKRILRSYKIARLAVNPPEIVKGGSYRMSDFLAAKSAANLQNVTLRLIAANLECGQYWRGSGTNRSKVTFSQPTRAVILFEKTTAMILKRASIETYFDEAFDFDSAFDCLRPDNMISQTHGLKFTAVIQIMVGDLADTQLELPVRLWKRSDFADHQVNGDDA